MHHFFASYAIVLTVWATAVRRIYYIKKATSKKKQVVTD